MRVVGFNLYERAATIEDRLHNLVSCVRLILPHFEGRGSEGIWGSAYSCISNASSLLALWSLQLNVQECTYKVTTYEQALRQGLLALDVEGYLQFMTLRMQGQYSVECEAGLQCALMWASQFRRDYDLMLFGSDVALRQNGMKLLAGWVK